MFKRITALTSVLFVASCTMTSTEVNTTQAPEKNYNFVLDDAADPHAMVENGTVYIYPTHGQWKRQFYAFSSTNLVDWQKHGPILDFDDIKWLPDNKRPWAPGTIKRNGKYYFYYSAGPMPSNIGVAVSDSPVGPFKDSGVALVKDQNQHKDPAKRNGPRFEAIDAMPYKDPQSGKYYLYAGGSAGSTLRVFELNDDMISIKQEIKVDTPEKFTEGAFIHYHNGMYHFTYSHGRFNKANYSIYYSTSQSPTGPWTFRGNLMKSDEHFKGPGHHSIIRSEKTGKWYMVYHRWENVEGEGPYRNPDNRRKTAIEEMFYDDNGFIKPINMTAQGVGKVSF
ncbi:family 43 glycosylhydrolase [Catenovulum agarivorans]|nr:family 43 glycosylhydrolase [Catenovulum agarivorans]